MQWQPSDLNFWSDRALTKDQLEEPDISDFIKSNKGIIPFWNATVLLGEF